MTWGKLYNHLFNCRLTGDYEDNYKPETGYVEPFIEPTKQLASTIESLIKDTSIDA